MTVMIPLSRQCWKLLTPSQTPSFTGHSGVCVYNFVLEEPEIDVSGSHASNVMCKLADMPSKSIVSDTFRLQDLQRFADWSLQIRLY
jgi:hypothetical protein